MKFLWVVACLLCAVDMMRTAVGVRPSDILAPDYVWLAWFPAIGWISAGYRAAMQRVEWF